MHVYRRKVAHVSTSLCMCACSSNNNGATFVVVGGGIAAVSCVEQLLVERADVLQSIALISAAEVVKAASNCRQIGRVAETFDIEEQSARTRFGHAANVTLVQAAVRSFDPHKKLLFLSTGDQFSYEYLCIATGGRPKVEFTSAHVQCIRDTESVVQLQQRLHNARRVLLVGNGGIATEFVHEATGLEVIWVIKHSSISATFVDAGAAEFFLPHVHDSHNRKQDEVVTKRAKYTTTTTTTDGSSEHSDSSSATGAHALGSALGPDWAGQVRISGKTTRRVHVCTECTVAKIIDASDFDASCTKLSKLPPEFALADDWPVVVQLSNGTYYGCDVIVSATGVLPNTQPWLHPQMQVADDGGLKVDTQMCTSCADVFAAGDVCTAAWSWHKHWMQMRLWTQARQMGAFAARCMLARVAGDQMQLDICFEVFTHVTQFFGFKVILLGCFNGQGLSHNQEALLRVTPGQEYIKVLVDDGRVQGAILIGETDLEETLENLILNQTDISHIKDMLLDPRVDIEDFFD